jgi:hypothetical protein
MSSKTLSGAGGSTSLMWSAFFVSSLMIVLPLQR